jgi:hypothetical protein
MNLRLRDVDTLKSNRVSLGLLYPERHDPRAHCDVVRRRGRRDLLHRPDRDAEEERPGRRAPRRWRRPARRSARGELAKAWSHLDRIDSDDLLRAAQDLQKKINDQVKQRLGEAQALEAIGELGDARGSLSADAPRVPRASPRAEGAKSRLDAMRKR